MSSDSAWGKWKYLQLFPIGGEIWGEIKMYNHIRLLKYVGMLQKLIVYYNKCKMVDMLAHTWNPNTKEVKAGESWVQGHL